MTHATEQFRDAIRAAGLNPPDAIHGDGKLRRFASNGHRGDDSGWYVFHDDARPAGSFGDWRSDMAERWHAEGDRDRTPAEWAEHRSRLAEIERERKADATRRHAEAAKKAAALWKAAQSASADHPYLTRKRISPVATLREISADRAANILGYAPQARGEYLTGRLLLAPIKVGATLASVEMIDEAGRKAALAGGAKRGGYWSAQAMPQGNGAGCTLLIGEGVATILSAHEATGLPALAALSCRNLASVAHAMRQRYPAAAFVILADLGNGEAAAEQAARDAGALLAKPDFGPDRAEGMTDFNDLAQQRGSATVADAIAQAVGAAAGSGGGPKARTAPDVGGELNVQRADELTVERVRWLWRGYLPRGKLSIVAGPAGTSKTTLALAIGATLTQCGRWPDGTRADVGDVLIWSGEDGIADTLLPRLIAHDANLTRVHFVGDVTRDGERRPFDPATDMPELLLAATRIDDLCLVIIDPVILAVRGDSNTNGDVRRGLFPLVKLAETTGAAVIGITHFSKGTSGKNPIERVTGSLAFAAAARVVLAVARIPEDQGGGRVVLRAKNNLGPDEGGFRFSIRAVDVASAEAIRIEWGASITGSAHDILNEAERHDDSDERGKADELAEFLRDCLTDSAGSMDRRAVLAIASRSGYSERACDRARERAGITARTQGFGKDRKSVWMLVDDHTSQKHPPKSSVCNGANGGNGANGESPYSPSAPLQTTKKCTREAVCNDDPASYREASRGT